MFQNNVWPSLCAPLDIVPLLPFSFYILFGLSLFFWENFDFFFFFFWYFSFTYEHKRSNHRKYELKKWKTWSVEFSEDMLEIDKDLVTTKRGSCDHFLTNLKISYPKKIGDRWIRNFFWSILIYGTSKSEFVCEN